MALFGCKEIAEFLFKQYQRVSQTRHHVCVLQASFLGKQDFYFYHQQMD